jgi:hypothetical protein
MAAQAIKSALPTHLKPPGGGNGDEAEFTKRHHGKTRSHMVSGHRFILVSLLASYSRGKPPAAIVHSNHCFRPDEQRRDAARRVRLACGTHEVAERLAFACSRHEATC